jgi:hypothetical protein
MCFAPPTAFSGAQPEVAEEDKKLGAHLWASGLALIAFRAIAFLNVSHTMPGKTAGLLSDDLEIVSDTLQVARAEQRI